MAGYDAIWKVVAEVASELHPDRIAVVASAISKIDSVVDFGKIGSSFGHGVRPGLIEKLKEAWSSSSDIQPIEVAAAFRTASLVSERAKVNESIEMVWTGPSSGLVPSRHTEQVLLQVIQEAQRKVFIVSFVAIGVGPVIDTLQRAIDRGVRVDILLESAKHYGGKVDVDSIEFFKKEIPSANIYSWDGKLGFSDSYTGAVHAKCAVADERIAFITSANLTQAALERNMELGVLVRGGTVPKSLARHLEALIATGIIQRA